MTFLPLGQRLDMVVVYGCSRERLCIGILLRGSGQAKARGAEPEGPTPVDSVTGRAISWP